MNAQRIIKIGNHEFTIAELIKKLNIEDSKDPDIVEVALCQKVPDGYIAAISCDGSEDNMFPGIDMELLLPEEKHSQSVIIARAEQKVMESDAEGGQTPARIYLYQRSQDSYVAYADYDARTDDEAEADPHPATVVVGGTGPMAPVSLYYENRFVEYCGTIGEKTR